MLLPIVENDQNAFDLALLHALQVLLGVWRAGANILPTLADEIAAQGLQTDQPVLAARCLITAAAARLEQGAAAEARDLLAACAAAPCLHPQVAVDTAPGLGS